MSPVPGGRSITRVEVAPVDLRQELAPDEVDHLRRPCERLLLPEEQSDRHEFDAVADGRLDL
jgi:hypothetical protein